jgi:hypothetical protein
MNESGGSRKVSEVNHPAFGSLIIKDFVSEHSKYDIEIKG